MKSRTVKNLRVLSMRTYTNIMDHKRRMSIAIFRCDGETEYNLCLFDSKNAVTMIDIAPSKVGAVLKTLAD